MKFKYRTRWSRCDSFERTTAGLTIVHITVGEGKRALPVTLTASPVAVVHALPVGKYEALVSIGGGIKVGNSVKLK